MLQMVVRMRLFAACCATAFAQQQCDLVSLHYSAALKRSASHLDKQDDFKVDWLYPLTTKARCNADPSLNFLSYAIPLDYTSSHCQCYKWSCECGCLRHVALLLLHNSNVTWY
jgi:hypothetical protein